MGVDAGDEVLAQAGIVQAAFLFHRQLGAGGAESLGEQAAGAGHGRLAIFRVELDAVQSAGGGLLHEDEATQLAQLVGLFRAIATQCRTVVQGRIAAIYRTGHRAWLRGLANQAQGRARHTQADGDFRAQRDEVEVPGEVLQAQARSLVPAVVADVRAEQAGADAELGPGRGGGHGLTLYK